jgi:hypothetical protein
VPYYMRPRDADKANNSISFYNGIHYIGDASGLTTDEFAVTKSKNGNVPDKYVGQGLNDLNDQAFGRVLRIFRRANADGLTKEEREQALRDADAELRLLDPLSTRAYLMLLGDAGRQANQSTQPGGVAATPTTQELLSIAVAQGGLGLPAAVVQWMETNNTGTTGWYDQGFTQTLMEMADFDSQAVTHSSWVPPESPLAKSEWVCVDGGSEEITKAMFASLGQGSETAKVTNKRVTSIKQPRADDPDQRLTVTIDKQNEPSRYHQVICTTPLGCMATMDLGDCLSYAQKVAVRCLQYDASCKIGIKFATRWWQDPTVMKGRPLFGGVSYSDTPLSNVVYPSYGVDSPDATGVLICSYTWAQDAKASHPRLIPLTDSDSER